MGNQAQNIKQGSPHCELGAQSRVRARKLTRERRGTGYKRPRAELNGDGPTPHPHHPHHACDPSNQRPEPMTMSVEFSWWVHRSNDDPSALKGAHQEKTEGSSLRIEIWTLSQKGYNKKGLKLSSPNVALRAKPLKLHGAGRPP